MSKNLELTHKSRDNNINISDDENTRKSKRQLELINKLKISDNQYKDLLVKYTPERLSKFISKIESIKYGINTAGPCLCWGPNKCMFFHACPIGDGIDIINNNKNAKYDSIEDFPIGDQCLLEKIFVEQRLLDYIKEFDIDPDRGSELSLINDLALIDLHKNRCVLILSAGDKDNEGSDFMKTDLSFSPETSAEIGRMNKEHPLVSVIEKLEKRRHKILEELLATRKSKAIIMSKFQSANESSKLLDEIEKVRKAIEASSKNTLVIESDDDILKLD